MMAAQIGHGTAITLWAVRGSDAVRPFAPVLRMGKTRRKLERRHATPRRGRVPRRRAERCWTTSANGPRRPAGSGSASQRTYRFDAMPRMLCFSRLRASASTSILKRSVIHSGVLGLAAGPDCPVLPCRTSFAVASPLGAALKLDEALDLDVDMAHLRAVGVERSWGPLGPDCAGLSWSHSTVTRSLPGAAEPANGRHHPSEPRARSWSARRHTPVHAAVRRRVPRAAWVRRSRLAELTLAQWRCLRCATCRICMTQCCSSPTPGDTHAPSTCATDRPRVYIQASTIDGHCCSREMGVCIHFRLKVALRGCHHR